MTLASIALSNLKNSILSNGGTLADFHIISERRAERVKEIRKDRSERAAFFRSGDSPYTRREHRWMKEVSMQAAPIFV